MYNQITNNMREIKFRAWDGKLMLYSPPVSTYDCCVNDEFYFAESGQSGKTFMQYTGLKDKNGKEIYEGDILSYFVDGSKYIIEWADEYAEFYLKSKNNGTDDVGIDQIDILDFEVIGNIYENPELLK